jgi:hypothetical protein
MVPRLLQRILTNRLAPQQPFDDQGKAYETSLTTSNRWDDAWIRDDRLDDFKACSEGAATREQSWQTFSPSC